MNKYKYKNKAIYYFIMDLKDFNNMLLDCPTEYQKKTNY